MPFANGVANRVAYRYLYARVLQAMSMGDALEALGFPPGSSPTPQDISKAYKEQAFRNHPDRGGDPKKMVEINVAKDVLEGKERPSGGYGGGYQTPTRAPYREPKEIKVTFEEAKQQAGIPSGVEWLFVTQPHYSGYSSDEFENKTSGWVAVGKTDSKWVFVGVEYHRRAAYFPGSGTPKEQVYSIASTELGRTEGRPLDVSTAYEGILKAWRKFQWLEKKFNAKVTDARNWKFQDGAPRGRAVSVKNFLLNLAEESGVAGPTPGAAPRKWVVEVEYEKMPYGEDRNNPPPGFFKPKYLNPYKLRLVFSGKPYELTEPQMERLSKLQFGGKDFMEYMFGQYYYGGERKVLTRKRGKEKVLDWMAKNLPSLPTWVQQALEQAAVQR